MALEAVTSSTPATSRPHRRLFDDMDPAVLESWTKRKRSKHAAPTEEEYLALCLVMLAHDTKTTIPGPEPPAPSYKCSVCDKTFSSYQALGGHKASHRKTNPGEVSAERSPAPVLSPSGKVHECSVCGRCFPTGQALGGHKRRHYEGGAAAATSSGTSHGDRGFDLNLPAMPEPCLGLSVDCDGKSQRVVEQEAESPLPVKKDRLFMFSDLGISRD